MWMDVFSIYDALSPHFHFVGQKSYRRVTQPERWWSVKYGEDKYFHGYKSGNIHQWHIFIFSAYYVTRRNIYQIQDKERQWRLGEIEISFEASGGNFLNNTLMWTRFLLKEGFCTNNVATGETHGTLASSKRYSGLCSITDLCTKIASVSLGKFIKSHFVLGLLVSPAH